jgi:hypothetical protein
MPIQINPVDFRGFSLGGPAPQLPNVGALGLQAVQTVLGQQNNAADRAAQERMNMARVRSADDAMLRQNILEREKMGQQNNQFQQSLGLDKNKLALLKSQNLAENAMKADQMGQEYDLNSQKIDLAKVEQQYTQWKDKQKMAQDGLKLEMIELAGKKKEEVDSMGAFATSARMAMDKVTSPEDARTLQLSILDDAVKSKYISADMAKQMRQMPVSGFKSALDFKIMQLDKVAEYKAMNEIQNPKAKGQGGGIEIVQPDGTVVRMQGLNQAAATETQKSLMSKESALNQFDKIEKNYDPDYFTYANKAGAKLSKEAEKTKGIPLVSQGTELLANVTTGMSKEDRAKFLEKRAGYMNQVDQMFNTYKKEITGAAAGEKEIEQLRASFLNGEMSPSEFKGSLDQVVSKYKSEADQAKTALGVGIPVASKLDYYRQGLKAKGYSDDEINTFLKSKGM